VGIVAVQFGYPCFPAISMGLVNLANEGVVNDRLSAPDPPR
jgi:hypothetical protein